MGCDAIRTSHNLPAPELVELCDEMGFMMMVEPFDEWDIAKCRNGYHRFFKEWAEKDMVNMLRHFRNNPAVVMWSIGNEVPSQCNESGYATATFLRDICKREDPTRPVTCGMDQVACVLRNGLASLLDVPGFNYRVHLYQDAYNQLSHKIVLGSETASTVSSRGVYKFPIRNAAGVRYPDQQCSSYDLEYCSWSNLPDLDFSVQEDYPWTIGQFVWTGFDYLGEPSPFWKEARSSYFGIVDLTGVPKDRYWLYRSHWNTASSTLHISPDTWTFPGEEGHRMPVMVYTDSDEAELFLNGRSLGRRRKGEPVVLPETMTNHHFAACHRYRLMWLDVPYEPGELKAVAYRKGVKTGERTLKTAGKPATLRLEVEPLMGHDDGELIWVHALAFDAAGVRTLNASDAVDFALEGPGEILGAGNGDACEYVPLTQPTGHRLFGGCATAVIRRTGTGPIVVKATSPTLCPASANLP
jgi:beta-galactosidase